MSCCPCEFDEDVLCVDSNGCYDCPNLFKVKGRFGLAWVSESPDCPCPEPIGWQVEFLDTPSKVEQKCQEMVRWINCPPLPLCHPCPPDELCSPGCPPRCNPCAPKTNPCIPKCCPGVPCRCGGNQKPKKCCCKCSCRPKRNCYPPVGGPCCRNRSPRRRSPQRCCCSEEQQKELDDVPEKDTNQSVEGSSSVLPQFLVQGGGDIFKDGSSGSCLYGSSFDDENFTLHHDIEGTVGMANNGPNTNCTQFYITTVPCPHLDGTNVAFGYVRKGMNAIREMADVARNDKNYPLIKCLIENCGEFKEGEKLETNEHDETDDEYPPWPNDFDEFDVCKIEDVVTTIKNSGNYFYNKKNFLEAGRKYKKVLRYIDFIKQKKRIHDCGIIKNIKLQTLVNLATVKYHKDSYRDVIDICTQVLDIDENHGKALYRRGRARSKLKDFDKALSDLQQASLQFPNDTKIVQEIFTLKEEKQNYLLHERKIFSKMFQ